MGLLDGISIFGYQLIKDSKDKLESFELDREAGVATVADGVNAGGAYVYPYETVSLPQTEVESIKTYRTMSVNADVDIVLTEIRNEIFIFDVPGKKAVDISFDENSEISDGIQKKIHDEYDQIYHMMQFDKKGIDYFNSWYVDGRIYFHKVIDTNDKKSGIKRVVKVDPLKMRKIREVPKRDKAKGTYNLAQVKEYYVYTDRPEALYGGASFSPASMQTVTYGKQTGLKILKDSVSYCDSGIYHDDHVYGFLHKAIVPFNNLKMMEEALLIYRVSRAPERRVIYVDVGNLPKNKAEQYMRELMNRFRNKLVYDSKTGSVADKRNVMSMIEDYWLPRRDGGKGTEISTLPGGENLGVITDVDYFKSKLMDSLNVPASRFSPEAPSFVFGKGVEVQRDEYRFKKFIDRLRQRFVHIFEDMLKTQLLLKNIITEDDWFDIRNSISWIYAEDNSFVEFKESEVLNNRINTLTLLDPFVGKYYSRKWVMKNVLKMSDEDIDSMTQGMAEDQKAMVDAGLMQDPNAEPSQ